MGHANSKLTENITIGYIHNNDIKTKKIIINELLKEKEIDRIIELPHEYGIYNMNQPCTLTPPLPQSPPSFFLPHSPYSSSSSTSSNISFLNNDNNNTLSPILSLKNDLEYIDKTYYNLVIKHSQLICFEEEEKEEEQQQQKRKITLKDLQIIDQLIRVLSLSQLDLTSISSNIGLFNTLRKLDLSNNKLTSLPESIGYLQSLECLYLGNNKLNSLPATIGYLKQLIELNISNNEITQLTPCIRYLKKLQYLIMPYNQIKDIPVQLFLGLKKLMILDVSFNLISTLPAEMTRLQKLKRIILEGSPIMDNENSMLPPITRRKLPCYTLSHSPPSLKELCARIIVRHHQKQSYPFHFLPTHLIHYLQSSTPCSLCQEPYFETFVLRGRLIERHLKWIPIEYKLCKAHYTTEEDRFLSMFSMSNYSSLSLSPSTSSSASSSSISTLPYLSSFTPYLPPLPNLPQHDQKQSTKIMKKRYSMIETNDHLSLVDTILQPLDNDSCFTSKTTNINSNNNMNNSDYSLNTWRSHRKKVMNKNHSGFLSLTK
ncbi:unnamed protein product [Cunninghamella blakesleeana]